MPHTIAIRMNALTRPARAWLAAALILTAIPFSVFGADDDADARLEKLERAVAALQQENKEIRSENKTLKQQVATLQQKEGPSAKASSVSGRKTEPASQVATSSVSSSGAAQATASPLTASDFKNMPTDILENGLVTVPDKSPLAFKVGPVLFTPLGFMDLTSVTRSTRNGGAGSVTHWT